MYCTCDLQAIATDELCCYLESQVDLVAPDIPALVPAPIKVERVGFTRNASNTPYIVYRVHSGSRCSRFIKRRHFIALVQAFLIAASRIEKKITCIASTPDWGLTVAIEQVREYIPPTLVNQLFEEHNQRVLTRLYIAPEKSQLSKVQRQTINETPYTSIKVGDLVTWDYPVGWGHVEAWFPFQVLAIHNGWASLDMLNRQVPVAELAIAA